MSGALKDMDVFILCGGLGKRLKEISGDMPKPMVKIRGRAFLDIIMNYLSGFGLRNFILGTGYKAEIIRDYYINNRIPDVNILFSPEKKPLDTGGAVKNARKFIKSNPFLVLNGDSLCKVNLLNFLKFHQQKKSVASILLKKVSCGQEYGEIKLDKFSRIQSFNEKNKKAKTCLINAGIYIFDKQIFSFMPNLSKFSLESDLFPAMAGDRVFGYRYPGFFLDIGTPERYLQAQKYFRI